MLRARRAGSYIVVFGHVPHFISPDFFVSD